MIKSPVKIFFFAALVILIAVIIDVNFFYQRTFYSPQEPITASSHPDIISRGEYLVYGPARCADCHGDYTKRSQIAKGEKVALSGGFFEDIYLGRINFPNITPDKETGIGDLSDTEIARFIRTGINHRGEYGLPFMNYQTINQDDLIAIISFLRAQPAINHKVPPSRYNFLGKLALAYFIRPEKTAIIWPSTELKSPSIKQGRYLVEALGSCRECHTNRSLTTGEYQGEFYAGGMVFDHPTEPALNTISPSLIPATDTGKIAGLSKEQFIARMQAGQLRPWSPMPWGPYSTMTREDLESIYLYLSTLKAIK